MRSGALMAVAVPAAIVALLSAGPAQAAPLTELASLSSTAAKGDGASKEPVISRDGRFVVFSSVATNFAATNGTRNIFLRDRQRGETRQVSLAANGTQPNKES